MHFLSHYYYELPVKSPLFVAGLSIPDLAPGFSKIYNSVVKNSVLPNNKDFEQIQLGILSHYEADKAFHNSPIFMNLLSLTTQSFLTQGLSRQRLRLSVIAHLAVELMIDRQILIENEQLGVDYYNHINAADESVLSAYFDEIGQVDSKSNFLIKFRGFKQRRILFFFNDLEKIVTGLGRIYQSVTKTEFTDDESHKFFNALNNIDNTIRYSWKEILNEKVYE
jgi:hypothetical protein